MFIIYYTFLTATKSPNQFTTMKLAFATAIVSTVYALPATNSTTTPLVKQQRRFEDFKRLFEAVFDPSEMNKVRHQSDELSNRLILNSDLRIWVLLFEPWWPAPNRLLQRCWASWWGWRVMSQMEQMQSLCGAWSRWHLYTGVNQVQVPSFKSRHKRNQMHKSRGKYFVIWINYLK